MDSKNFLREHGYDLTYSTTTTTYGDRVEALKNSLVNNSGAWKQGVTIAYVISSESDDRGMAIIMKRLILTARFVWHSNTGITGELPNSGVIQMQDGRRSKSHTPKHSENDITDLVDVIFVLAMIPTVPLAVMSMYSRESVN